MRRITVFPIGVYVASVFPASIRLNENNLIGVTRRMEAERAIRESSTRRHSHQQCSSEVNRESGKS